MSEQQFDWYEGKVNEDAVREIVRIKRENAMKDSSSSNPLLARLHKRNERCGGGCDECGERKEAIAEIERLTAELETQQSVLTDYVVQSEAERDRLKATVEELWTVSAGLRAALQDLYDCQSSSDGATQWRAKFDSAMKRAREALAGSKE